MTGRTEFNENIQILRAVAVLLVLLFHLEVASFAFGYLGVDLFFLISGFLMPVILHKYNATSFIVARISRIYPALILVTLVTFAVGYLLLIPYEYSGMSWSAISAAASASNIYFYLNSGYFDQSIETQPLLHTWSLGNEFMCYVVVSIFLVFKRNERGKSLFAISTAIISAAIFIIFVVAQKDGVNYYNPFPRAFLFFLAFYVSSKKWQLNGGHAIVVSGIAIGLLVLVWGPSLAASQYPSLSVFAVAAAGLPILMLQKTLPMPAPVRGAAVWLGDISYSIYLWHWPLIVFEKVYLRNFRLNYKEMILIAVTTLIVATASYYLIERRRIFRQPWFLIGGTVLVVAIGVAGVATNGFSDRFPAQLAPYAALEKMRDDSATACEFRADGLTFKTRCEKRNSFDRTLIFAGDSHSRHFITLIERAEPNTRVLQFHMPLGDAARTLRKLDEAAEKLDADRVYIAYYFKSFDADQVRNLVSAAKATSGKRIKFVQDIPNYRFDPVACYLRQNSDLMYKDCAFPVADGIPRHGVANWNSASWSVMRSSGLPVLETHGAFCEAERCRVVLDGWLVMRDANHLNERLPAPQQLKLYNRIFSRDRERRSVEVPSDTARPALQAAKLWR